MKADILVCAPATMPLTTRGSIFDRHCSKCGQRVMVAPSSQRMLKQTPGLPIICLQCYFLVKGPRINVWAAPAEEIERERRDAVPNLYPRRN